VYFVDNVRFRELPATVEETLFSWETPDNPGTPAVNEQYEGWVEGFHMGHTHSLVSTGATHGSTALQIDRTSLEAGFAWGSQFLLSSDTDPGPGQVIDPVIQARIDQLADDIMGAQSVAFDLTYMYTDQFPAPAPSFTKFGLHFTDITGVQYQAEQPGFVSIPSGTPETTVTIEIPLTSFIGYQNGIPLLDIGFAEDTPYFRISLSTNTDGAQIYQIDNFRLISLAPPEGVLGDFNDDGKVDAADYVIWRKNTSNAALPNDDGLATQAERFALWKANFGNMAMPGGGVGSAVPEPASIVMLLLAAAAALPRIRRGA
jgi:hypothetical protein